MKNIKYIVFAVALIILFALTLTACNNDNQSVYMTENVTTEEEIGISPVTETVITTEKPEETTEPETTQEEIPLEYDIIEAKEKGLISVNASGKNIQENIIKLENLSDTKLIITIPQGLFLAPSSDNIQNMLVLEEKTVTLIDKITLTLPTACMNIKKNIPNSSANFTLGMLEDGEPLKTLLNIFDESDYTYPVKQAAVWILTDNATYGDVSILQNSITRVSLIKESDYKQACSLMNRLNDAGVIITIGGKYYSTNLTHLNLSSNQITDITLLSNLTNLTHLNLSINQINDITPLSNLTNLTELWLTYNQITDITLLSNLTNLTFLELGNNHIADITPLSNLTNLTELGLRFNGITDWSPVAHVPTVYGRP